MIDAFKKFIDGDWPESIAHLKGKVLIRRRDGYKFRIVRHSGESFGAKPCAYLEPVGCSMFTRSHWKTHEKILAEMSIAP
ncbi:hypothetical protein AH02_54 [Pseudomonas phage AH02]|nr:hypothetical protein AH02_54 [Pseudomonas phage AH02]